MAGCAAVAVSFRLAGQFRTRHRVSLEFLVALGPPFIQDFARRCQLGAAFFLASHAHQHLAAEITRAGITGVEADDLIQFRKRRRVVPLMFFNLGQAEA